MDNSQPSLSKEINIIRTGPRGATSVILLHAVGIDLTLWTDQIAALRHEFDVIAFDFPGHGLSQPLNGEPTFAKFTDQLLQLIETLSSGPVHLVGISFGGMIAQMAAIKRPDLIRSLSLLGTTCAFPDAVRGILRERAQFVRKEGIIALAPISLARWFAKDFTTDRPDVIDRIKKILHRQDAEFHAGMWDMISTLDTQGQLMELSLPAIVIVGSEDTSTPIGAAQLLADALHTGLLHVVPDTSHLLNLEAPEIINGLLLDFLRSV